MEFTIQTRNQSLKSCDPVKKTAEPFMKIKKTPYGTPPKRKTPRKPRGRSEFRWKRNYLAEMPWDLNARVCANSPSLCPTMFSVTNTLMKTFPL